MNFSFAFYWSLLLRRLPVMMVLFLICSTVGVIIAYKLPPTFATTARLQLEAPQIPDAMVASTIQTDALEQLQVIQEQLMTRANLIDIAQQYQVFPEINEMTPDEIVRRMQEQTRIFRSGGRDQATLMTISFEAAGGVLAANVVNAYVTLVLEANSRFRRERTQNTLTFFDQEVARLEDEVSRKSAEIILFKNENINALPEDLIYRQGRQTNLQERLSRLEQDRASIIRQRSEIIAIFEATGELGNAQTANNRRASPEEVRLAELELELQNALAVFSESNPKVALLRSQIDALKGTLPAAETALTEEEDLPARERSTILNVTLTELDQRLQGIDEEVNRTQEVLKELEGTIARTATNTITLEQLERELDNIQAQYNRAQNNQNEAQMAERLELTARGQRITLIEGASVPQQPSGPPRLKIAAAGVGGGLGLAAGFFFLLEYLNRTIRRPVDLHKRFGVRPLGAIPYLENRRERILRRSALLVGLSILCVSVPLILGYIDQNIMPLELALRRVMLRLSII